jgi:2-amino-4-hydroxy-6-hydroxymethyldihydropteridine diphosphokinase
MERRGLGLFFFGLMGILQDTMAFSLGRKSLSLPATMAQEVYISLGGNLGQRHRFILGALEALELRLGQLIASSQLYETPPWGFESDHSFLNAVAIFQTSHSPQEVLEVLLKTERTFGRKRIESPNYTSRTLDLDLLFYGNEVLNTKDLQLPHPRIPQRAFVLVPLAEIAADYLHPVEQKTIRELLTLCPDKSQIHPWKSPTVT